MNTISKPLRVSALQITDGIAEFTHQTPETRNAVSTELRRDYVEMLDFVADNPDVRVLIIAGSGGSFCAGGSIKEMRERRQAAANNTPDVTRKRIASATVWLNRLRELEKIVIAAVDGPAYGGGFSLALHADFVLASSRATFAMSFPRVGVTPDYGSAFLLPRIVGLSVAKDLLLTGRTINADEALRLGLVRSVHPAEELLDEARRMARAFCKGPSEVFAMTKAMLNRSMESDYVTLGGFEAYTHAVSMAMSYHGDAVDGFLAKKPPRFDWDRDVSS
jgi:2-(1,2-epoxy-1,2-dihydrophenyl)acetyl-CoA isomerase